MFTKQKIFSEKSIVWFLVFTVGFLYFFSNPAPQYYYDYSFRIAEALLHGRLGLTEQPPSWLNEMVKVGDQYVSVFPLGSVLTMLPIALLKLFGAINQLPSRFIVSVIAALLFLFSFHLSCFRELNLRKRILLAAFPVVCTWAWTNLSFGSTWQIALGFAVLGQIGALYFILVQRSLVFAGAFFALAFGNRTEVIILIPVFFYLIYLSNGDHRKKSSIEPYAQFLLIPGILLILTVAYNYARFSSFLDFGYARIPGVLEEPWYMHGIFSVYAIPLNFYHMLMKGWDYVGRFPYVIPYGFGGSILLSSPYLFLLFRENRSNRKIARISWIAIFILTAILWIHGNPGGWQFSYRYAMILIPWFYLVLLLNSPKKTTVAEIVLFTISFLANAYATYLYNWTDLIKP